MLGLRTGPATQQLQGTTQSLVFVNREPIGFCTLAQYVGSYATVAVTAAGNQMVAARIDVALIASPPPPPAYSGPPPYPYYYYPITRRSPSALGSALVPIGAADGMVVVGIDPQAPRLDPEPIRVRGGSSIQALPVRPSASFARAAPPGPRGLFMTR